MGDEMNTEIFNDCNSEDRDYGDDEREAALDREHDEKAALGYL